MAAPISPPIVLFEWNGPKSIPVVIAIGGGGLDWLSGLELAEVTGHIHANNISVSKHVFTLGCAHFLYNHNMQIAEVYAVPSVTIVVLTHRLPMNLTDPVARSLLTTLSPKRYLTHLLDSVLWRLMCHYSISVVILDTYAVPAYISPAPLSTLDPPVLYLQTSLKATKSVWYISSFA